MSQQNTHLLIWNFPFSVKFLVRKKHENHMSNKKNFDSESLFQKIENKFQRKIRVGQCFSL